MPLLDRKRLIVGIYALVMWIGLGAYTYVHSPGFSIPNWVVFYTLLGFLMITDGYSIRIASGQYFTLESVYLVGFSFLYPMPIVIWAGLAYAIISSIRNRKHWELSLVGGTGITLCVFIGKTVYSLFAGSNVQFVIYQLFPLSMYLISYFVTNLFFMYLYAVIRFKRKAVVYLKQPFSVQFLVVYGIIVLMGILLTIVINDAGLSGAILFTGLVLLISYSYRDYFKMANHFKQLATTDELTSLHNHRYIQSIIDERITAKQPFALLMIDIDNFKHYNEVYGHVHGDEALQILANVLEQNRLPQEEIARYSGEEFAIVLPNHDIAQAQLKAETLRRVIAETKFPGASFDAYTSLTVSVGVARYPEMADDKRTLLMMVDDALYKGKVTGRNKVTIFTSVLDEMKQDLDMNDSDEEILNTIKVFLAVLNSKDRYTYAHTERDVRYAEALARKVGLNSEQIRYLRFGAFLHDIGKVEIPLEVLTKRGPLSNSEWSLMKTHVELGENIARPIKSLYPCLPIIRHHHERFDGTGYPDGLKGTEIPLEARILTIADSFDAMTTSRPYQKKRSMDMALEELKRCSGTQFDPELVDPFIQVVREIGLLSEETEEEAV